MLACRRPSGSHSRGAAPAGTVNFGRLPPFCIELPCTFKPHTHFPASIAQRFLVFEMAEGWDLWVWRCGALSALCRRLTLIILQHRHPSRALSVS